MAGPKAPKDPERKRPYFYIMKDKDIYGSVQEDGSIIHFIYESDGRLINSAQIAGNIENKEELGLLETVEGFGRLVHSIGVSVETDNQNEQIEFVFQMYGKQDLYGGGTNLKVKLTGDGMERMEWRNLLPFRGPCREPPQPWLDLTNLAVTKGYHSLS